MSNESLNCSVAIALDFLGDSWSFLILRDFMVFGGTRRFEQLREGLGISRNVLTERLKTLLDQEIIRKQPVEEGGRRMLYKLSRKGWDLIPILAGMNQWCLRYRPDPINSAFEFIDAEYRKEIDVVTVRSQDGRVLGPPDIRVVPRNDAARGYFQKFATPGKTAVAET